MSNLTAIAFGGFLMVVSGYFLARKSVKETDNAAAIVLIVLGAFFMIAGVISTITFVFGGVNSTLEGS